MAQLDLPKTFRECFNPCIDQSSERQLPYFRRTSHVVKSYAILFTPRSGSTWLTHYIAATGVLGHPDEYLNLRLLPEVLRVHPAISLFEYYDNITSMRTSPAGVFGMEISLFDLLELEKEASLSSLMTGEKHFVYLRRVNFVQQAVSMYIAEMTGQYHLFRPLPADHAKDVPFDVERIKFWAMHILQQEFWVIHWLQKKRLTALCISYEQLLKDIDHVVLNIATHLDCVAHFDRLKLDGLPVKLANHKNIAFEAMFKAQKSDWCSFWETSRGTMPCDGVPDNGFT